MTVTMTYISNHSLIHPKESNNQSIRTNVKCIFFFPMMILLHPTT